MGFSDHFEQWLKLGASDTVLNWIREGVKIPFEHEPAPFFYHNHNLNAKETQFVNSELSDLLLVGAIEKLNYKPDFNF